MHRTPRLLGLFLLAALRVTLLPAQSGPPPEQITGPVQRLFAAMRAGDTTLVRTVFVPTARVIPVPAAGAGTPGGLTVDQFVAFVGRNPAGSWIERVWSPTVTQTGPLASLWFEYDVYRGATLSQCGVQSVQLVDDGTGWKILTMTFTAARDGCPAHPPPGTM